MGIVTSHVSMLDTTAHLPDTAAHLAREGSSGSPLETGVLRRLPETEEEALAIATGAREHIIGEGECALDGSCMSATDQLLALHPDAERWHGNYDGEFGHDIAKLGDYFIDITADQFGDAKINVFTQEQREAGKGNLSKYWGFEKTKGSLFGSKVGRGNKGLIATISQFEGSDVTGEGGGKPAVPPKKPPAPIGNANPKGCNQYTGPGCGHPDAEKFLSLPIGTVFSQSRGGFGGVDHYIRTQTGFAEIGGIGREKGSWNGVRGNEVSLDLLLPKVGSTGIVIPGMGETTLHGIHLEGLDVGAEITHKIGGKMTKTADGWKQQGDATEKTFKTEHLPAEGWTLNPTHLQKFREALKLAARPPRIPSDRTPSYRNEAVAKVHAVYPSTAAHLARDLPEWVPTETKGNEENTGFVPVKSSWIGGLKYTPERGTEMMVSKGGKSYAYPGFRLDMFRRWVASRSKGKFWWRHVGHVMMSRYTGEVHKLLNARADIPRYSSRMTPKDIEDVRNLMSKMLGVTVEDHHIAALAGHLDGSRLTATPLIGSGPSNATPRISFTSYGDGHGYSRTLGLDSKGTPYLENDLAKVDRGSPSEGVSGGVLLRQMRAAHELGIPKIKWHALESSNGPWNGGRHWPLLGADGILGDRPQAQLPPEFIAPLVAMGIEHGPTNYSIGNSPTEFKGDITFKQLFSIPGAREWYANHSDSHNAFVDTAPGSYSRVQIEKHVAEKSMQYKLPLPTPDNQYTQKIAPTPPPPVPEVPATPPRLTMSRLRQTLLGRKRPPALHPMTEHLLNTWGLHPDYYDDYFTI